MARFRGESSADCCMTDAHAYAPYTAGPKASLDDTVNSQPALFVAGLAAVEKLRADNPSVVESASACAGLSLGEYCALVFAGVLSFEDGLKVVKVRAQSMAAAAKQGQHGMLSVVGMADPELENICNNVVKNSPPGCALCLFYGYKPAHAACISMWNS